MKKIVFVLIFTTLTLHTKAQELAELEKEGYHFFYELDDYKSAKKIFEEILSKHPNHFYANYLSGMCDFAFDNYEGSLNYLDKAINIDSITNADVVFAVRGMANYELGNYKESVRDFDKAIRIEPEDHLFLLRGKALRKLGEYEKALEDFNKSIDLGENSAIVYIERGLALHKLAKYEDAIRDYEKSLKFNDNYPDAYYFIGEIYYDFEMYEKALEAYTKYRLVGDDAYKLGNAHFKIGVSLYYINEYEKALEQLSKLEYSDFEEYYLILGMIKMAVEDYEEARINLEKARKLSPENSHTVYQLGKLEHLTNNSDIGYKTFLEAKNFAINDKSANVLYFLSESYFLLGDTLKALSCIDESIKIDPKNIKVIEARISVNSFFLPEKKNEILSDMELLKSLFNDNAEIKAYYMARKSSALMEVGDIEESLSEINKAIGLDEYGEYYAMRSFIKFILEMQKQPSKIESSAQEDILKDIDRAAEFNHRKKDAYLLKTTLLIAFERNKEACEAVNEAIKLGAEINKDHLKYICKGKEPKEKNNEWDFFYNLSSFEERFEK